MDMVYNVLLVRRFTGSQLKINFTLNITDMMDEEYQFNKEIANYPDWTVGHVTILPSA